MAKQTPEAKVKAKINDIVAEYRGKYTNPIMQGMGQNGTHDKLVCINGFFVSVEAKAGKGGLTSLQAVYGKEIYDAGGIAVAVNESNLDDLRLLLAGLASGELVHSLSLPSDLLTERGAEPAPFELIRRAAYYRMWIPFLKNDKLVQVGSYGPYTPVATPTVQLMDDEPDDDGMVRVEGPTDAGA